MKFVGYCLGFLRILISGNRTKLNIPEQLKPSPLYPESHAHIYDPTVLLQVAFA